MIGQTISHYRILEKLGAGGMGEVYRARDTRLGRDVAVKVLPASFASDSERLRRFEQEARATGALNHPNILAIYDIGRHDGIPFLVTELLEGETLRQYLNEGSLPLRKALDIATQVARGVAAAHEKGFVHRDLKPANVFLTSDGRVKILDFGLAKLTQPDSAGASETQSPTRTAGAATEAGVVLGTVGYMSPEQVRGKPADARSDLFALGTILYEMLSGQRAFEKGSSADTMAAILKEDPPELSGQGKEIPPAVERVVRHCLEKSPAERFQSARDLAFDLEALSGLSGASATAAPGVTPGLRGRLLPILSGLAILAALAAGVFIGGRTARVSAPVYHRLAFRRGTVMAARFAPDGRTVVYSAAWSGKPYELFTTRPESPESRSLGLEGANVLAVSPAGEIAVSLGIHYTGYFVFAGTLARVPLEGGAPREILENVEVVDWAPDGANLLVVREVGGRDRLEFPREKPIYETGGWIGHARFSPQGDRIAFLDHPSRANDDGSVAVVDLVGHRQTLSTGWIDLTGLAWSPGGEEVWFTGTRTGSSLALTAVSLSGTERQVAKIAGDFTLFDIRQDGAVLMARDDWRAEIYGLASGENQERDLSWFDFSFPTDLSADGKTLLFAEGGEGGGPNSASFLRKTDGSVPVRLSDGFCRALSRDGQSAICVPNNPSNQLFLVPTKAGETRQLTHDQINHMSATLLPDKERILILGTELGHGPRLYVEDLAGGKPQAITPEGVDENGYALSPDGKEVAVSVRPDYRGFLFPVVGDQARPIPGLTPGDRPIRWSEDGRSLYIRRFGELPTRVFRFDLATGKRTLWKELMPPDPSGVSFISPILLTPDAKSYVYGLNRKLSDLYLVEGLK